MTFDWLNITPTSGGVGKTILALSVNSKNMEPEARQKQFKVIAPDGITHVILTVTQEKGQRDFSIDFGKDFG